MGRPEWVTHLRQEWWGWTVLSERYSYHWRVLGVGGHEKLEGSRDPDKADVVKSTPVLVTSEEL